MPNASHAEPSSGEYKDLYESDDYTGGYHSEPGRRLERLLPHMDLHPRQATLELGCGPGLLADVVHSFVGSYDGVDYSEKFIAIARERTRRLGISNATFHATDIFDFLERTDVRYDVLFAMDFVEHVNDRELTEIFRAASAVMNPGARFYAHTPNGDFLLERLKSAERKQRVGHIAVRNAEEYRRLFGSIGYRDVEVLPLSHYIGVLMPLHVLSRVPLPVLRSWFQARLLIRATVG